ncbi:MAG: PAS domain-containing protein [Planctomycetota bacterium]|jgi:PAS domain S-box-containing protein
MSDAADLTKKVAAGESVFLETVRRHRQGTPVHVSILASPIVAGGEKVGVYALYQDIEERRRAEDTLRKSEKYYRSLFENAHDAILIFTPKDEIVLDVNRRACDLYGYERTEFIGLSLKSLSRDIVLGQEQVKETLEKGRFHTFETVQFRKDGTEMSLEVNASVVEYMGKWAILSMNQDITARKTFQRELSESEEKYRAVLEQSQDCIYLAESDTGRIVEANKAMRDLLGYTREEILERTVFDVIAHPREDVEGKVRQIMQEGHARLGERSWRLSDGRMIPVDVSVDHVTWRDRNLICVVARDMSQRKRAEEDRIKLRAQLNQSQKMEAVGLLAGGIAHDNRTSTRVTPRLRTFGWRPRRPSGRVA